MLHKQFIAGFLGLALLGAGCASTSNDATSTPPPPQTNFKVVYGWVGVAEPDGPGNLDIEIVNINGYCTILAYDGYRNSISTSFIPNTPGSSQNVGKGCP